MLADLEDQLELLAGSCTLYDSGKYLHGLDIAIRLSVIVDWLVSKDGGEYIKANGVQFRSYAIPPNAASDVNGYHGLCAARLSMVVGVGVPKAKFVPLFEAAGSPLKPHYRPYPYVLKKLGAWKSEKVLGAAKGSGKMISRETLLDQMRNKAGGAHPSSSPSEVYAEVANELGLGLLAVYQSHAGKGTVPYKPTAPFATVRQMAYEVSESLK